MKTSQKGDELKKNREYTNRRWFWKVNEKITKNIIKEYF
jgi:hypothetical protein